MVGAQHPRAQGLQWFLSESTWAAAALNGRRLALLRADPTTRPDAQGVLVIDEHGDRKWGHKTAHVGRQYLANLGKTDSGVVAVTSLWADARVYYPLDYEPYTPKHHCAKGKADSAFRTKLPIAGELVAAAVAAGVPFRAVVADSFYGEDAGFCQRLHALRVGYGPQQAAEQEVRMWPGYRPWATRMCICWAGTTSPYRRRSPRAASSPCAIRWSATTPREWTSHSWPLRERPGRMVAATPRPRARHGRLIPTSCSAAC